ncbi:hypothetical protein F4678DRAFT_473744 [Xylaria arbuscula]|nr:hypothetical protein F4678DRAFT_473744 [Xylaria arbuscula]
MPVSFLFDSETTQVKRPRIITSHGSMAELVFSYDYANGQVKVPGPWRRGRPPGGTVSSSQSREISCEFIHVSPRLAGPNSIDTLARSRIRRHAKRHADKSREARETRRSHVQDVEASRRLVLGRIPVACADPFNVFPAKLEPYMLNLLKYYMQVVWRDFYKLEATVGCNPMADFWMPLAFQDAALLHTFIGCADAWISGYGTERNVARETRHLQETILIINDRLKSPTITVSKETIAIVAGMALIEKGLGRHEHWRIHMRGLRRLVDLVGGLESLSSEPLVLYKIYRADLYGALDALESPFFPRPVLGPYEAIVSRPFRSHGFNAVRDVLGLDDTLCFCIHQLEEAMQFWDANGEKDGEKNSPSTAARTRHLLTEVQYTLIAPSLQHRFDTETYEGQMLEYCRISLILYTLTVLRERPPTTSMGQQIGHTYQRVVTNLIQSLRSGPATVEGDAMCISPPIHFHLWTVFLAASVMRDSRAKASSWVLGTFREMTMLCAEAARDWRDLSGDLSTFLWIPSIHDEGLEILWSEMRAE